MLAIALVAGWLGCSSNGQPCGCTADEVCLASGACVPACGTDGATCPAGFACVQAARYCATPPCDAAAAGPACIVAFSSGGY
jgi:hypothetical protein